MSNKQIQMSILLEDVCLAFVINSAATSLNGGFSDFGNFLAGMFQAFCINYIAGLMLPVAQAGMAAANGLHLKEGTLPHKLVRVFVINAIFVTIISFTMVLIDLGPVPEIFPIWWNSYPILHIVGFCSSFLLDTPCLALASVIVD